jgi:hypothetical protein
VFLKLVPDPNISNHFCCCPERFCLNEGENGRMPFHDYGEWLYTNINRKEQKEASHMRNSEQDFFSTMMFGPRPPRQSEPVKQETEAELAPEATDEGNNTSEVDNTNQLVQVIALIQAISPIIEQVKPVIGAAKEFWQSKKETKDGD